jgi:hypothetical protein
MRGRTRRLAAAALLVIGGGLIAAATSRGGAFPGSQGRIVYASNTSGVFQI